MEYKKLSYQIVGVSPLLMHNGRLADPTYSFTKEMKKISSKRKKVDSDYEQMAKLDFFGGLYLEDKMPIIPAEVMEATLVESAKRNRLGKVTMGALYCPHNFFLSYEGEQDVEKRFDKEDCKLVCGVVIGQSRVMRTRPLFKEWSANIEICYDPERLNETEILEIIRNSGNVGLMDWRPKFGRFKVEI